MELPKKEIMHRHGNREQHCSTSAEPSIESKSSSKRSRADSHDGNPNKKRRPPTPTDDLPDSSTQSYHSGVTSHTSQHQASRSTLNGCQMGEAIYTRPSGLIPGKSDAKGAILRKPLRCLGKDSLDFLEGWLESVIFKILSPDKFDSLSLSDAEKILSSLVQDICQKLNVNDDALRSSPLADSDNSPASSAKPFLGLTPAPIGETSSHFYAALVNRRCSDISLKILIQGGHAGSQGLVVQELNQYQFHALAVWVYVEAIRDIGNNLQSQKLILWIKSAEKSLFHSSNSALIHGTDSRAIDEVGRNGT